MNYPEATAPADMPVSGWLSYCEWARRACSETSDTSSGSIRPFPKTPSERPRDAGRRED